MRNQYISYTYCVHCLSFVLGVKQVQNDISPYVLIIQIINIYIVTRVAA